MGIFNCVISSDDDIVTPNSVYRQERNFETEIFHALRIEADVELPHHVYEE